MKKNFKEYNERKAEEKIEKDFSEIRKVIKESKRLLKRSYIIPVVKITVNKNLKRYVNKLETNGINFNF